MKYFACLLLLLFRPCAWHKPPKPALPTLAAPCKPFRLCRNRTSNRPRSRTSSRRMIPARAAATSTAVGMGIRSLVNPFQLCPLMVNFATAPRMVTIRLPDKPK